LAATSPTSSSFSPEWVETITVPSTIPTSTPEGMAIMRLNHCDGFDKSLMPDVDTFRRGFIYKSFNREVVAASLGAAFNVTTLFEPMIARGDVVPYTGGAEPLDYLLPNIGGLP
jgi:hypothetical protein